MDNGAKRPAEPEQAEERPAKRPARSRTAGADALAIRYPHPVDARLRFEEAGHRYLWNGVKIPRSVTGVLADAMGDHFDPVAVVDKNFEGWRRKGHAGEYGAIFDKLDAGELDEAAAKQAIRDTWAEAAPLGTELHRVLEVHLNEHPGGAWRGLSCVGEHTSPDPRVLPECAQFDEWARSEHAEGIEPLRTEMSVVYRNAAGQPVCAGQIDLLAAKDGRAMIVDWKRVKKKNKLTATERAFRGQTGLHPFVAHVPKTHFHKYSLQTSCYAVMLQQCCGYDVGDNMWILRMHQDRPIYQWIKCHDYRAEAKRLLDTLDP